MSSSVGSATARNVGSNSNIHSTQATDDTAGKKPVSDSSQQSSAAKGGSDPSGKIAEHQLEGQMRNAQLAAVAEKQLNPIAPNTTVDITNPDMRKQLLRSCPQINPISTAAGNGPGLCGAASMANALVLSSKTPEQAKANAQAVRDLAKSFPSGPMKFTAAEDAALKKMEAGKMSPTDVQHLQQAMHKLAQKMPTGGLDMANGGLSTAQMTAMMSTLSKHGAFKGSSVTLHCNSMNDKFNHWTTTVDGVHANSQVGKDNKSTVMGGPPNEVKRGTKGWENELWLNNANDPSEVHVQVKGEKENEPLYFLVDTSKYDTGNLGDLDFDLRTKARPRKD